MPVSTGWSCVFSIYLPTSSILKTHLIFKYFLYETSFSYLLGGALLFSLGASHAYAEKAIAPITADGAWSLNSQPSVVYHNGKTYFAWINAKKNLIAASYDHATGETK